jgi:hypothetical protein
MMAKDNVGAGILILGSGLAGLALGRWWLARRGGDGTATGLLHIAPVAAHATGGTPTTTTTAATTTTPRAAAPWRPGPRATKKARPVVKKPSPGATPVSSPSQVDPGPMSSHHGVYVGPVSPSEVDTGPVSSPSQVDPAVAAAEAAAADSSASTPLDPYPGDEPPEIELPAENVPGRTAPLDPYPADDEPSEFELPAEDGRTPSSSGRGPKVPLSRQFDPIFNKYRGAIPIEFLRALATRESGMNPGNRTGPAWGLMQIVKSVREDYNQRHGTAYTREDLLDPAVNVAICCWLLRSIIAGWARRHPEIPNLQADWGNAHFAALLVFGWNAGFSERGGVGRVARYLKARGETELTIDIAHRHARAAGASRHLSNPKKVAWCKSVVLLYARERAYARRVRSASGWGIKTPGVILSEMRITKTEIEALGRDIYNTFRRPFEAQLAQAEARFETAYGRIPGAGIPSRGPGDPGVGLSSKKDDRGRHLRVTLTPGVNDYLSADADYETVHSWMDPIPTAADVQHASYHGQFVSQWSEFEREWGEFWAEHADHWSDRMWRGAYDQALDYRKRAIAWRAKFEEMGGAPTTPVPTIPVETFFSGSIPWKPIAVIGGLVLAGLVVVPHVLASIRSSRS